MWSVVLCAFPENKKLFKEMVEFILCTKCIRWRSKFWCELNKVWYNVLAVWTNHMSHLFTSLMFRPTMLKQKFQIIHKLPHRFRLSCLAAWLFAQFSYYHSNEMSLYFTQICEHRSHTSCITCHMSVHILYCLSVSKDLRLQMLSASSCPGSKRRIHLLLWCERLCMIVQSSQS